MSETTEPGGIAAPAETVSVTPTDEGQSSAQAETEAPPASATAEEPGAEQPQDDTPAWAKKRFAELTAKMRAAERRAEMAELAARGAAQQPNPQPAQETPAMIPPDIAQWLGQPPNPADFTAGEFDPAYTRAAVRYDMREDQAKQAAQQRAVQQRQSQAEFGRKIATVMESALSAAPDVESVLSDPSFPMPQHVVAEVVDCESPGQVLAYLGRNPAEAARLAQMNRPSAVARELAKIEARLAAAPPAPVPMSSAPPPPRTMRGGSPSATRDPSRMSMDEYAAWRNGGH